MNKVVSKQGQPENLPEPKKSAVGVGGEVKSIPEYKGIEMDPETAQEFLFAPELTYQRGFR
jgi:hypothetical protein